MTSPLQAFEAHRASLLGLAYRMLGDFSRAEDMVQEAWLRWERQLAPPDCPKAWLVTTVTRLCLDDLDSARARHEEPRGDRLPEPVDLAASGLARLEVLDRISMAFVVLLQRLTPDERAVFLLHDVFDVTHAEVGALIGKTDEASRQLLKRARDHVAAERAVFRASTEEHRRLLHAFLAAVSAGDRDALLNVLAPDAVCIVDAGEGGPRRFGNLRAVGKPVVGAKRVASLMVGFSRQSEAALFSFEERELNGAPAVIAHSSDAPVAAISISVSAGAIRHVFVQTDPNRLRQFRKGAQS